MKLKRKKKKIKTSNVNVKTEPKVDINIKTEPDDNYGIVAYASIHAQTQFGEHFMAHEPSINDANKIVKSEVKEAGFEADDGQITAGENGSTWINQQSISDDDDDLEDDEDDRCDDE
jgi:hypothetical protein